jgi:hypothetical protein
MFWGLWHHVVLWGGYKHFGCTCFLNVSSFSGLFKPSGCSATNIQVFWGVTPRQCVNTATPQNYHKKISFQTTIRMSLKFHFKLLFFLFHWRNSVHIILQRKDCLFQFLWPDGGCIFHLISYFPSITNSTYNQVFRTYLVHKSGSTHS